MVEASKFMFESSCSQLPCSKIIHPWTDSCKYATASMLMNSIKGAYQFYAVVYMLQILMKGKKLTKEQLVEQFKLYLKSGVFGFTVGTAFVPLNCIFRRIFFNSFNYYTTVLLPCTVSGLAVFLEPPYRRVLVVNLFVNLVFEYWVRTLEFKKYIKRTTFKETAFFMFGSSILFYLMRKEREKENRTPIFWLFTPPKVSREVGLPKHPYLGSSPACPHKGSCLQYFTKGTLKMFGIGCAMTMLRTILPNILQPRKAISSITVNHWRLGLFFGGYIGIYRLVTCLLCRKYGQDRAEYALPAGLLAGTAFRFSPSLPISLATFTGTLQLIGSEMYSKGLIPEGLPLVEILYCLCQGLLFHARVMHPDTCPKYILNLMKTVTNGKANEIQQSFMKHLIEYIGGL